MESEITATELARNLSDILNRVKYRRESFKVVRNGEVVAELRPNPNPPQRKRTWGEFVDRWPYIKPDPEFWDVVEQAHRELNQPYISAYEKQPAAPQQQP